MKWYKKIKSFKAYDEFADWIFNKPEVLKIVRKLTDFGVHDLGSIKKAIEKLPFEFIEGLLFAFFGEKNIIVTPYKDEALKVWGYDVHYSDFKPNIFNEEFPDRPSASIEGFEKAFEILEKESQKKRGGCYPEGSNK